MKKNILLSVLIITLFLACKKETTIHISGPIELDKTNSIVKDESITKTRTIKITKNDTLYIIVRADGAPGMYLDTDGTVKGFYVELEKKVMEVMGQKYEFIPYTDLGPMTQKMKTGEYHSALAVHKVEDYKKLLNISTSFETLENILFVHSDSNMKIPLNSDEAIKQLFNKKVGVQTRGHIYQYLRDYKEIELVEYPTTTKALEALHENKVDVVPDVKRIGLYYKNKEGWNIKPLDSTILSQRIGTGFSKVVDVSIVQRYNIALNTLIENGYVANLHKKYFGE